MTERRRFITDARNRVASFTALCRHYGISRTTGYKWLHRADQSSLDYLAEVSADRAPVPTRRHPSSWPN